MKSAANRRENSGVPGLITSPLLIESKSEGKTLPNSRKNQYQVKINEKCC